METHVSLRRLLIRSRGVAELPPEFDRPQRFQSRMNTQKVLIVDDDESIARLYQLQLQGSLDIDIATSGQEALQIIQDHGPFAVVVSDMQMPEMNGNELFARVAETASETVRVMLTGNDDQRVAVQAVNEGQIFRFLNKPCPAEDLAKAIEAGMHQYRLVRAEKELLDKTLHGSIGLMVDMLSTVKPLAFGRAVRIKAIVGQMLDRTEVDNAWEVSLAAMLSQIGCVSIPDSVLEKCHHGEPLTTSEAEEFAKHPAMGSKFLRKIPRLDRIGELIAAQSTPLATLEKMAEADPHVLRAAYLRIATGYDELVQADVTPNEAIRKLKNQPGVFSSRLVEALAESVCEPILEDKLAVALDDLTVEMVLDRDLKDRAGRVLITKGQQITEMLIGQLERRRDSVVGPIYVRVAQNAEAVAA